MNEELKGLKRKLEIVRLKNNNRLKKVMKEIDVTNKSIIFFEKNLAELNNDNYIEVLNKNLKKEKKDIINIVILAFIISFIIILIQNSMDLILGKCILKIFIQKLLATQIVNISLSIIIGCILIFKTNKNRKYNTKEEINRQISEKGKELENNKTKLKKLQIKLNDLESLDLAIKNELSRINKIQNDSIMEKSLEISKQKVKK